ncbi:MAG: PilC/PilY family type IV pilus protein, partial [Gemmatimonadales bacterium]
VATTVLKNMNPLWEAGARLAQTASSARDIRTWVDTNNDGVVDSGEELDFTTTNAATLAPYLRPGAAPFTTTNIINFTRGDQIAGLRDRQLTVASALRVWKLGDAIHSQPIVVGAPAQRYDVVYGDTAYKTFFTQYKERRQVAYLGANDGMLHAFNAGYFHRGDDPSTTTKTEHGWFTRTPTDNSSGPLLGDELFGFIPYELLPHLKWLTRPDYTHVYYVDLTPKVTDVRIFTPDADHPGGWGTILIGGFRLGGSCGACLAGTGAPPMAVTADFDNDAATADTTRTFYSAYFVMDITNPESADYPKLLWSFSSSDLGLTAAVPSMLRVSPAADATTDNTNAKWYLIAGSGPTGYEGEAEQDAEMYAIDLKAGPGANNSKVVTLPADSLDAFLGNTLTVDLDFDYRVDATYVGSAIDDGTAPWRGKLNRLTMNTCTSPCSANTWGIDVSGDRVPTEILDRFPASGALELGPILAAPAVTIDDANKVWVFAGTGRLFGTTDKASTEQQYFVGVKDSVMNNACTQTSKTNCHDKDLVDLSSAKICVVGTGTCGGSTDQVTGVTGATDFPALVSLVASKDGWYTTLPGSGERVLARPLVFGGLVVFPTFTPTSEICNSTGSSNLYALYYKTGSAYSSPVIGNTTDGSGTDYVNRSTSMGQGLSTEAVVHLGKGSGDGKAGVFTQNSLGQLFRLEVNTTGGITSRLLSWYPAAG